MDGVHGAGYAAAMDAPNQPPPEPAPGDGGWSAGPAREPSPPSPATSDLESDVAPAPADESTGESPPLEAQSAAETVPPPAAEAHAPPLHEPPVPTTRVALVVWLAMLVAFGVGGALFHQEELALLAAFSGVFVAANVADEDRQWRELYYVLGWVPPVLGVLFSAAVGAYLWKSALPGVERAVLAMLSAGAAGLAVAIVPSPIADRAARAVLMAERPRHLLHLTVRCVVLTFALIVPGWFAAQDALQDLMRDPKGLLDKAGLSGGLIGYVLLAFAGVGWLVRRDLRGTLARLGLRAPRLADLGAALIAVGALWALNTGGDWIQHRWFHAAWVSDHAVTESMATGMGTLRVVLLGLSAGIGEEITMRGALQPRLGIVLTSLMFAGLHVQYSWTGMVVIFLLGTILGLVRQRASTTAAMIAHAAYDMLAIVTK
jgi:hypothetical protein